MSFFEKFAKLKSDYKLTGDKLQVGVYDDEIDNAAPIMWLSADINTLNSVASSLDIDEKDLVDLVEYYGYELNDKVLDVSIVNVNDKLYFNIPEKKRNMMATVLFKKFLNVYSENWGKGSSYWMPVRADFANYELQEKFKKVVTEKQIFPEISSKLIGETSAQEWENSYYNINNREDINTALSDIVAELQQKGINIDSNYLVSNYPVIDFYENFNSIIRKHIESGVVKGITRTSLAMKIQDSDIVYHLPINTIDTFSYSDVDFYYRNETYEAMVYRKDNFQAILNAEQNMRNAFANVTITEFNKTFSIDEFIQKIKEQSGVAANLILKRLIKKNSSK